MYRAHLQLAVALLFVLTLYAADPEAKPGQAIDYRPFYPAKWAGKHEPWDATTKTTKMFPWEGKRVVLLTTQDQYDGKTMAVFLNRLDAGWKLYEDIIGEKPKLQRNHNGKVTIAAVPGYEFISAGARGAIGATGIEVGSFYKRPGGDGDFDLLHKNPEIFHQYFFYEMGRNYYVFGARHNAFMTGFAVFMSNVCMDTLGYKYLSGEGRVKGDLAEKAYSDSKLTFAEAFLDGKKSDAKSIIGVDANALYAAVMRKLRADFGGNDWVKRFYGHIQKCPPLPPRESEENLDGQALYWVIAASAAAKQDLTPLFEKRWRFPLHADVWRSLKAVDWKKEGLTVTTVLDSLPSEHLPYALAVHKPSFLTPERRKKNLITGGTFEEGSKGEWQAPGSGAVRELTEGVAKEGKQSLLIRSTNALDAKYLQRVKVTPNTWYLLSGWVRTQGVTMQVGGTIGANLSLSAEQKRPMSITGDTDWTYLTQIFNSGNRSQVAVCARLGFRGSAAKGSAWFDDLVLIEIDKKAAPE